MPYTPPATPWQDLPSEETPVTAAWLTQVDETLVEHDQLLADLENAASLGEVVNAKGDLLVGVADDTVDRLAVGNNGGVLTADSTTTTGLVWAANPVPAPVTLTDAATVNIDAAAGRLFRLSASGNRTVAAPTNAIDGRMIVIAHYANGGSRTLTLSTSTGGFKFGSSITSLTATSSGTTDYIGCIYNASDERWHVVAYVKGL